MAKNKLQNIKALKEMLQGTHKFQTKKSIGFSDTEAVKKKNERHKVGDKWEETDSKGTIYIVEQFEGFRTRKPKNSEVLGKIREELRSFPKCPKETCTCDPSYYLNKKMRAIHGMCFECVIDMEHELKSEGKFNEYAKNRIEANAMDWLKRAEQDVEMLREAYTQASKVVINGQGDIQNIAARMSPEEFEEQITKGFEQFKEDFIKKLNKNVKGITDETDSTEDKA